MIGVGKKLTLTTIDEANNIIMVPCAMWNSVDLELGGLFGVGIIVSPARIYDMQIGF